jgi:HAD superfamily hydrolase (TIGR01549 family)
MMMSFNKLSAIIFDLDGTLCRYGLSISAALEKAFRQTGYGGLFGAHRARLSGDRYKEFLHAVDREAIEGIRYGSRGREALRRLLREAGLDEGLALKVGPQFIRLLSESVELLPEAARVIESLENYELGLITNGPSEVQWKKIRRLGIEHWFAEIIVSGDLGVEKPDGAIFARMLTILDVEPEEALYVGDSLYYDIQGAKRAGLWAAWLNPHGKEHDRDLPQPDLELRRLEELLPVLAQGDRLP